MKFTVCIDTKEFGQKPDGKAAAGINSRIAKLEHTLSIQDLANKMEWGYSWCPTTFYNNKKSQANFKSQQVFALDFDGGITLEAVLSRAQWYHLPVCMTYETFSSENCDRFRVVFIYREPVREFVVAKMIQYALCTIFPEADKSGKDCTKLYFAGKNTITYEPQQFLDMESLIIGLTAFINQSQGKTHFIRKLKSFCAEVHLLTEGTSIKIDFSEGSDDTSSPCESGNFTPYSYYIYKEDGTKLPYCRTIYFYTLLSMTDKSAINRDTNIGEKKPIRNFEFKTLMDKCALFHDFSFGIRWLNHDELMLVTTNLIQIEGGRKKLGEILECYPEYYQEKSRMDYYVRYVIRHHYQPYSCEHFCPYNAECDHSKNIILTVKTDVSSMIRLKGYDPGYVTLEEAYKDFQTQFYGAMKPKSPGFTVMKGQTGIGKTSAYLDYLQTADTPCIIAVPTNRLKEQVTADALMRGMSVTCTPSVEPLKEIKGIGKSLEQLYRQGAEDMVGEYLRKINQELQNPVITSYLKACENTFQQTGHIITTHARFLYMKPEQLARYRIIIDEDIINSAVQIKKINIEDIYSLKFLTMRMPVLGTRITDILNNIQAGESYFPCPQLDFSSDTRHILWAQLDIKGLKPKSDISALFTSPVFYYDKNQDELSALKIKLPDISLSGVILSATADELIYNRLFHDRPVRFIQSKEALYKGQIIQTHNKSYSRDCIRKHPEIYDQIREKHRNVPVITFKNFDPEVDEFSLHIGATEGNNQYTGQDIVIVGTPHMPDFMYKLIGMYLGFDITSNLTTQEIEHNGFRQRFCTYADEHLRHLQLWFIESELEQCIGRARLLRNDCTVYLYSNFPVKQTILEEETQTRMEGQSD
ncbi:hypothetical protein V6615_08540 [Oscillospiraceae bacterium PP1C4]